MSSTANECKLDARYSEVSANWGDWKKVILPNRSDKVEFHYWRCHFDIGISAPVRVNPVTNEVECFSNDGKIVCLVKQIVLLVII